MRTHANLLFIASTSNSFIFPSSFGIIRAVRPISSVASTAGDEDDDGNSSPIIQLLSSPQSKTPFWRARLDCWRPDVRDVERISWGQPAKKKGTGSRGIPHRLNDDERQSFDRARRDGYLQVIGSAYRSQRRDAPLLNTYRSLMDARGRPMIVLHKLPPPSGMNDADQHFDRIDVDLSPLRLPDDFSRIEIELRERILVEFGVNVTQANEVESSSELDINDTIDDDEVDDDEDNDNEKDMDEDDDWGRRPLYQLSPYFLSWKLSRQQGKQIGKYLGSLFDNVEEKGTDSKTKPKGVKPGKGRRHGGYGIG